jgi:penicillin-binding protein 1A
MAGTEAVPTAQPMPGAAAEATPERTEERRSILDLFKR